MSVTSKWTRRNAHVEAVRVNRAEVHKIAFWCGGDIMATDTAGREASLYILVPVAPTKFRKANRAFMGDWILKDSDGYKVYSHEAFSGTFIKDERDTERFAKILKLVKETLHDQCSVEHSEHSVFAAKYLAAQILDLG